MNEGNNKSLIVSSAGVVLLLTVLGVIVPTKLPFRAERPPVTDVRKADQLVRARLWQDPAGRAVTSPPERGWFGGG